MPLGFRNLPVISPGEMAERVFNGLCVCMCSCVHVQVYSFGLKF